MTTGWTRSEEDRLISLNRAGYAPEIIGGKMGKSPDAIFAKLRRLGEMPNRSIRKDGSTETRGGGARGRPEDDPDDGNVNPDFLYEAPGYYIDRAGTRWLVGEDADGDLVGINVLSEDPTVQFWDPNGRVRQGAKLGHVRDLIGPYLARRRPKKNGRDLAMDFHRSN